MGCGWSVIGHCQGNGRGGLCHLCQEEQDKNEWMRTHCWICKGKCTDENSYNGARALALHNEHAQCRIDHDEKFYAGPRPTHCSKKSWEEDKEFAIKQACWLRRFLGQAPKPKPQLDPEPVSNVIRVDFRKGS